MTFAHSFWSKPLYKKKFFDIEQAIEIILYEYALSASLVHKFGHKIVLYTDQKGYDILNVIPYDDIIIVENTITDNHHFAASIKFEALKRMSLGDTLIDGDIFLHRQAIYNIIKTSTPDVLVSFFEPKSYIDGDRKSHETMYRLLDVDGLVFDHEDYDSIDGWYNTSLIHFNSQELKDAYIDQYIKNVRMVSNIDFGIVWPDVVIEQRNLARLCESMNKTIDVTVEGFPTREANDRAFAIGMMHIGAIKAAHHPNVISDLTSINPDLISKLDNHIKEILPIIEKSLD